MLKYPNATALKADVAAARADCKDALRRDPDTSRLWLVSRGAWVRTIDAKGEANETDSWPFLGTAWEFVQLTALTARPDISAIYIEGGFNAAESGRDYADGNYDPWVGEWSVAVFNREEQQ